MTRSIFATGLFSVTVGLGFSADAADLIRVYERQPAQKQRQYIVQREAYDVRCDELIVEYRRPYVPHTDIVRFCDDSAPQIIARY